MVCSSLCFVGILAEKIYAVLLKEPVSLPLCAHRSSDLVTKGLGTGTKVGCSASNFPRPHDWLTARAPMLLETGWQVSSPAGLCVRTIAFCGSDLTQSLKFISVAAQDFSFHCAPLETEPRLSKEV